MGFAVMDGFDLGVAMWLPILSKTETDKHSDQHHCANLEAQSGLVYFRESVILLLGLRCMPCLFLVFIWPCFWSCLR